MELRGKMGDMDCKEFERLIPDFISNNLDYSTLKSFINHMEKCKDCKEELIIRFLVSEGIQHLEDGITFDLQSELDKRLEETKQQIKFHDTFVYVGIALEVAAACLLAGIIIWILL